MEAGARARHDSGAPPTRETTMKLRALAPQVLLVVGACREAQPESEAGEQRAAIAAVLDGWHAAAARADGERYFACLSPDAVFIGTDASERWTMAEFRAYAQPHFAQGRGWSYRALERHVVLGPDGLAWFDERLASEKYGECRGSGVLRREAGAWRIVHYVLSFPVPNAVVPAYLELLGRCAR
jgi:ketosteroid isomerase-like protein